jgi:hypothetical protein
MGRSALDLRCSLEPFIVVAPQLPTRGDIWHRYADAVRAILRQVL